jgi:dihydropteroate synthase
MIDKPLVMGILNVTPDSFFDGGRLDSEKALLERAEQMLREEADMLDLGAMSTRPGAMFISEEQERRRLLPAVKSIRREWPQAIISVDTFRADIAREAVEAGADIINDISGGTQDKKMFETIAQLKAPYIMMHMQGTPENMQKNPHYEDVVKEVGMFFSEQLQKLKSLGVHDVILDPGFGFGKTLDHNFQLLHELRYFDMFELPLLVGVSRKSMVNRLLGTKPETALNGTTAVHVLALERGADILRVHDVKEARQAVKVVQKLREIEKLNLS